MKQQQKVKVDRETFQSLHSAGRSLFQQALQSNDHSAETAVYLTLLNKAIDEGHRVLGTQRAMADKYIELVSGITQTQRENAEMFLRGVIEREQILDDVDKEE